MPRPPYWAPARWAGKSSKAIRAIEKRTGGRSATAGRPLCMGAAEGATGTSHPNATARRAKLSSARIRKPGGAGPFFRPSLSFRIPRIEMYIPRLGLCIPSHGSQLPRAGKEFRAPGRTSFHRKGNANGSPPDFAAAPPPARTRCRHRKSPARPKRECGAMYPK